MIDQYGWYLFCLFIGISIGHIYADLVNQKHSDIRSWWKHKTRLFDVEGVFPAHEVLNNESFFNVKAKIRFVRPIKNATILLDIYRNDGVRNSIEIVKNEDYAQNREVKIRIARIPEQNHLTGTWGDARIATNTLPILNHSKNVAVIDVQTSHWFSKRQKFQVHIEIMGKGTPTGGRFYLATEADDLFKI